MALISTAIITAATLFSGNPGIYGQVFAHTKSSHVMVATSPHADKFTSGFIVGARNEFVFGSDNARVDQEMFVKTSTGAWLSARILAYSPTLKIGLGRIAGLERGRFTPLQLQTTTLPREEEWLVVLKHDKGAQQAPFAGTLREKNKHDVNGLYYGLDIPGELGSPVLDTKKAVVGVVFRSGRRKSLAWPVKTLVQFLKGISIE